MNSDGRIGFSDFLSFARSYGNTVPVPPPTNGGGGSSRPDLIVESPSVSESTLTSEQSFTLQATVRNRGTWQSTTTTLEYYRSVDARISTTDREIGTDSISGLSASGTVSKLISLTAPSRPGTYYYGACVASVSGESNTTNNCSEGVRVTVEGSPDLIVESPSVDNTTPTPGQTLTLSATVRNQGTAEVAATTLRYYQSSDATITTDDTEVGKDAVPELAASATSEQSSSVTAPLTAGTYYYGACVASVSGESNTTNNCSEGVRVTVKSSPDLIVESVSVSESTLTSGQSFTLQVTVRNRGTWQSTSTTLRYYRSTDATITDDDREIGTDSISGLSASGTVSKTISLTAPSRPGTYYYGACVGAAVGESNTDNNCSTGVAIVKSGGDGPALYWTEHRRGEILYAYLDGSNLDGSQVEKLITGLSRPGGIVLDLGRGKMYWTDRSKIQRANLDGSQVEKLITPGWLYSRDIVLDVERGKMYWTDVGNGPYAGKIQRANLDGSRVEKLITTGLINPFDLALDLGRGKMYWTDPITNDTGKIQRANLDGSNVEDLIIAGVRSPRDIVLDLGRGKMYWTDPITNDTGKIQRANLDGSNVEDLIIAGVRSPRDIVLDLGRGKMYWSHLYPGKILRANLDGSQVEELITPELRYEGGLALDLGRGKMYWAEISGDSRVGNGKILRANLDGSNVEDLITGVRYPLGIVLDLERGKMYWADFWADKIQRANLDGSNVEDLITTGRYPTGFALDLRGQ